MSNYPAGAENDPNAPWNEVEQADADFDVAVTVTLSKVAIVNTNDYADEWFDGEYCRDTSNTDWSKAYRNNNYTIPEMLDKLKEYIEKDIEQLKANGAVRIPYKLQCLLDSCQGWEVDETEFETM